MEAATLRARGGIDRARMQIRVEGKGAKERVLPMSPHLLHVLEEYWLAERKGRPGHGSPGCSLVKISKVLSVGRPAATSTTARSKRAACGPRAASMSYAIVLPLISLRVELTLVQRLLGHTSLITTARYLHVTRPRLVRVCSALELIDTEALTAGERP